MYISQSAFENNARDRLTVLSGRAAFGSAFAEAVDFICREQLMKPQLWHKFAEQFSLCPDDENSGWRCEYWGKMMRGAAFVYGYTRDAALYSVLEHSINELLELQDSAGRISTYSREHEFSGWDMWGRKYVLLGMQYFYEICDDDALRARLVASMCRQADYIFDHVGEDKLPIDKTSSRWLGLNSMSILEPFVRLYNVTKNEKYLNFASYIVKVGMSGEASIFALAAEDRLRPHEYPVTKAYEMMSCFEGLAEYYRVCGGEEYRAALLNFGRALLECEVSVIGCCGCTHELFDHTAYAQTDDSRTGIMQETCVSVTLMKLLGQLLRLSGDSSYMDCIERTFFNAYLGSLNTQLCPSEVEPRGRFAAMRGTLPFDSYSLLRPGVRGAKIGGLMRMENGEFYGCCACIASAGAGLWSRLCLLGGDGGVYVNSFIPGRMTAELSEGRLSLVCEGNYPYDGNVRLTVDAAPSDSVTLWLRMPSWSRSVRVAVNGAEQVVPGGDYYRLERRVMPGDIITLELDMTTYAIYPYAGAPGEQKYVAFRRGPIILAADNRLGVSPCEPVAPLVAGERLGAPLCGGEAAVEAELCSATEVPDSRLCVNIHCAGGAARRLIDYASAGKTYDERSLMAAWLEVAHST